MAAPPQRIDIVETPANRYVSTRTETAMRVAVRKWGNSASVRIPAAVMAAAKLRVDQTVEVREEDGRVVIEPVADDGESLSQLLVAITDDNLHGEIDFGAPRGRELL